MEKHIQDTKTYRKFQPQRITDDKTLNQAYFPRHRLTYVSCFVVITFIVCITQQFTFVLNYSTFVRNTQVALELLPGINATPPSFEQVTAKENVSDDWQKITDRIYVYSAYWDDRLRFHNGSFVRIIGGADFNKFPLEETKCLAKYSDSNTSELTAAYAILLEDHHRLGKPIYIKCQGTNVRPEYVSLVPMTWNETWPPLVWLPVRDIDSDANSSNVGLCVRPMYGSVDSFRVAEFIAYHEAVGVDHFTFYVYDVPDNVTRFLRELKKKKFNVEVLPWTLPRKLMSTWAYGQMASINDCIYRQMKSMAYTVVIDIDEFVTPRKVFTLQEFLKKHDSPGRKYGSFVFRSTVFCSEYKRDVLPQYIPPFITQSRIYRRDYLYPFGIRTKYVVKPSLVETAGIHFVWAHMPSVEEKLIGAGQVLVHHYRSELCLSEKSTVPKGIIDVKSRKYLNQLLRSKVIEVWQDMFL